MTHIILPPYEGKCTFNVLRYDGDNSTRPRAAPSAQTIISHNILEGGGRGVITIYIIAKLFDKA